MSIKTGWLIEDAVIFEHVSGTIDIEDMTLLVDEVKRMLDQSDRVLVHALIDVRNITNIPTNIRQLANETTPVLKHPRKGWVIVYGQDNKLLQFVTSVVTGIFQTRLRIFLTLEEALDFLQEQDTSLPSLNVQDIETLIDQVN